VSSAALFAIWKKSEKDDILLEGACLGRFFAKKCPGIGVRLIF